MGKLNELPQSMQKCVKSISADLQKIFVDSMSELAAEGGDWSLIGMNDKEKIRAIKRIGKEALSTIRINKLSEGDYKTSLQESIKKSEENKKSILVSLQEPEAPSDPSSAPTSLIAKDLKLKKDLGTLNELKSTRLSATAPLIEKYAKVVGKLTHMKSVGNATTDREHAEVTEYPTLLPENYVSKAGAQALEELIAKRSSELQVMEEEEAKLEEENDKLMKELGVGTNDIEPPPPNLTAKNAALKKLKQERMEQLRSLGDIIGKLWSELGTPNEERAEFQGKVKVTGIKPDSETVGQEEVKRLRAIKASKQSNEIKTVRDAISTHWEYCGYSDDQKNKFEPFERNPVEDENSLKKHEAYLEKLKAEFETKKPILLLIQKYKQLSKSRQELFDLENNTDPSKLSERRNSAKQALETSKLTATVTKDMPRCLQKLVQSIKSSEATPVELADGRSVRKPFMYKGERYLATLDRQEKEFKKMKEQYREDREKRKMEKRVVGAGGAKAASPTLGFGSTAKVSSRLMMTKKRAQTRIAVKKETNAQIKGAKTPVKGKGAAMRAVTRTPTLQAAGVSPTKTPTKTPMGSPLTKM